MRVIGETGDVHHAADGEQLLEVELAQGSEGFDGIAEFFDGMSHDARRRVSIFGRARRDGNNERLAFKRGAFRAVSPAVFHNFVDVKLEQAGDAVPVHGIREDDNVSLFECRLFRLDVELIIGIKFVELANFDLRQPRRNFVQDGFVRERNFQIGVPADNHDVFHLPMASL